MGIDAHALHALRYARTFGPFGKTVTLGRQGLHMPHRRIASILEAEPNLGGEKFCERLLVEHFQATHVDSIDNSDYEGATILHDMNKPLPASVRDYDTVLEIGTIEHVFDVAQALRNVAALSRVGGQIVHVAPADNFCGHGFWQMSPELFFSLYSVGNGFEDTEVFLARRREHGSWYRVHKPAPGERVPINSSSKVYVICRTVRSTSASSEFQVQQSDYLESWGNAPSSGASSSRLFRLRHKHFRGISSFNPNLEKVAVSSF